VLCSVFLFLFYYRVLVSSSGSIFNVNIITPTSRDDNIILRQLFHQCISHESNAWQKICVFRPDLKTEKQQVVRRWSGNVFQSLGAAALKAAAAEEEVTIRSVIHNVIIKIIKAFCTH